MLYERSRILQRELTGAFRWTNYLIVAVALSTQAHAAGNDVVAQQLGVAEASNEGLLAIKKFEVAAGLTVSLFAAEPLLANPVSFTTDEHGRWYVAETFRVYTGAPDVSERPDWGNEDLACQTVEDKLALLQRKYGDHFHELTAFSETVVRIEVRIEDRIEDGVADHSTVFADGFNSPLDGIRGGILARKGDVWFANIPNLWLLRDTNGSGVANFRKSLHTGYGIRVAYMGHDLHGLRMGPDGRLYFSIGDRGLNVQTEHGRLANPNSGAVLRCNSDGSGLEIFATGLRNPQELAFDKHGNLFTVDNNSDQRIRQEAQFALAERGDVGGFSEVISKSTKSLARLHAIWGIDQIARAKLSTATITSLLPFLADADAEVRAQTAKVLGEQRVAAAYDGLARLVTEPNSRVQFFAAMALGKLGRKDAVPPLFAQLKENGDRDRYLRHAGSVKQETADWLELNSPEDGFLTLRKSDITDRRRGLSGMPEGFGQSLSKRDLRNLMEFLADLK